MRRIIFVTAATLLAAVALQSASAQSITVTVDCNRGQTIAHALGQGDFRKPLVVNVRGTCREFVTITRENVTLHGDPSASINAPNSDSDLVTVDADGVTLDNLTLSGGYYGVRQEHAFRFMVSNCVIQDTRNNGMNVFVGDARLVNSTIQRAGGNGVQVTRGGSVALSANSQVLNNAGAGINAQFNSTVIVRNTTVSGSGQDGIAIVHGSTGSISNSAITSNGGMGVFVYAGSHVVSTGNTIRANGTNGAGFGDGVRVNMHSSGIFNSDTVSQNRGAGIAADFSDLQIDGAAISSNGDAGVGAYLGSVVVFHGSVIRNNGKSGLWLSTNSTAQVEGVTVQNNASDGINVNQDSKLQLVGTDITDVRGNGGWGLACDGHKSSVNGTELINGTISPTCAGYN